MKKNLGKSWALVLLLMMVVCVSAAFAETPTKNVEVYPATPEGVVKALVSIDFDGSANELIGDINKRTPYFLEYYHIGTDNDLLIASKYRVIKLKENSNKASVEVVYEVAGYMNTSYKFYVLASKKQVIYELIKEQGFWKITSPIEYIYISVETAIKIYEGYIKNKPQDSKETKRIKGYIHTLKTYLKNNVKK